MVQVADLCRFDALRYLRCLRLAACTSARQRTSTTCAGQAAWLRASASRPASTSRPSASPRSRPGPAGPPPRTRDRPAPGRWRHGYWPPCARRAAPAIPAPVRDHLLGIGELVRTHRQADLRQAGGQPAEHGARSGVRDDRGAVPHDQRLGHEEAIAMCSGIAPKRAGSTPGPAVTITLCGRSRTASMAVARQLGCVEDRAEGQIDRLLVRQIAHLGGQRVARIDRADLGPERPDVGERLARRAAGGSAGTDRRTGR